jgi:antitoxin component YwqK of YwqJK toxin-antitoxin module
MGYKLKWAINLTMFGLLVFSSSLVSAQQDSSFIHKSEARNITVNGLKEGKWLEYLDENEKVITDTTTITDTSNVAVYYRLTVYRSGIPNGIVKYYYKFSDGPNPILYREIPYTNGKINGVYKNYFSSGALRSEYPYHNGVINGVEKEYWDADVIKAETPVVNGKINGLAKFYDENGKLKSTTKYVNDKAGITKEFDENGKEITR